MAKPKIASNGRLAKGTLGKSKQSVASKGAAILAHIAKQATTAAKRRGSRRSSAAGSHPADTDPF